MARTVPASSVLRDVRKTLREGWPAGLTLLTGDDLYHLDAAQRLLLEALVPREASDFALTVYGEERVDVATVVAAVRTVGMFAPRRVVLLRVLGALDGEPDALAEYAAAPPANSHLLVRAPELDRRRKLHKTLEQSGHVLRFAAAPAGSAAMLRDVRELAAERELRLDAPAAAFLAEIAGGDLHRAAGELDKIAAWLGAAGERRVSLESLREVASGSGLLSGWEVADAVLRRDRSGALAAVARLVEAGDEPIRIVGGLAWRARVMLQAKALLEAGAGAQRTVSATRAWAYRDALLEGLSRYELAELLRFPAHLLAADRCLKSRAIHPRAVLERLVDSLTETTEART